MQAMSAQLFLTRENPWGFGNAGLKPSVPGFPTALTSE